MPVAVAVTGVTMHFVVLDQREVHPHMRTQPVRPQFRLDGVHGLGIVQHLGAVLLSFLVDAVAAPKVLGSEVGFRTILDVLDLHLIPLGTVVFLLARGVEDGAVDGIVVPEVHTRVLLAVTHATA